MKRFFGIKPKGNLQPTDDEESKLPPLNVLVMDGDRTHNWPQLFHGNKARDGRSLNVYQASWNKVEVTTYGDSPSDTAIVHLQPIHSTETHQQMVQFQKTQQKNTKEAVDIPPVSSFLQQTCDIKPHFLLIRNQPRGAIPATNCLNAFYGLMMANIPSINSLQAVYMNLERPIMLGALRSIEKRVGHDKFPLINATYYSSERQMVIAPEMPAVIKIGHAHAGLSPKFMCFVIPRVC